MLCGISCKPKFYKPILCVDNWLIYQDQKEKLENILNGVIYEMSDEEIQKHKAFNIYLSIKQNGYINAIEAISEEGKILFITMSERNTYIIIMNIIGTVIRVYTTEPYNNVFLTPNQLKYTNYLYRIRALINSIHFHYDNIKLIIGFDSIFFSLVNSNAATIKNNEYLPIFYSKLPLAGSYNSELTFLVNKYPIVPMLVFDKCFKIYNNIPKKITYVTGYKNTWCLTNTHIHYINPNDGSTEFSYDLPLNWKTDEDALTIISCVIKTYSNKHHE